MTAVSGVVDGAPIRAHHTPNARFTGVPKVSCRGEIDARLHLIPGRSQSSAIPQQESAEIEGVDVLMHIL